MQPIDDREEQEALAFHLARSIRWMQEAVTYTSENAPNDNHNAGIWHTWMREARARLVEFYIKRDRRMLEELLGQPVWYYDKKLGWIPGTLETLGAKDGLPVGDLSMLAQDYGKWGYGWQFRPYAHEKPAPPDLSLTYP